jgi:hypothetical protein
LVESQRDRGLLRVLVDQIQRRLPGRRT